MKTEAGAPQTLHHPPSHSATCFSWLPIKGVHAAPSRLLTWIQRCWAELQHAGSTLWSWTHEEQTALLQYFHQYVWHHRPTFAQRGSEKLTTTQRHLQPQKKNCVLADTFKNVDFQIPIFLYCGRIFFSESVDVTFMHGAGTFFLSCRPHPKGLECSNVTWLSRRIGKRRSAFTLTFWLRTRLNIWKLLRITLTLTLNLSMNLWRTKHENVKPQKLRLLIGKNVNATRYEC